MAQGAKAGHRDCMRRPHCILAPKHILENPDVDFHLPRRLDYSLPAFLNALSECPPDEIRRFDASRMQGVSNTLDGAIVERGLGKAMENLDNSPFPEKSAVLQKKSVPENSLHDFVQPRLRLPLHVLQQQQH